jgi:uncharacterized damage-inducible protein DinB
MNANIEDLLIILTRELNSLKTEIEKIPDDKILWQTVPGVTNSVGNLTLHICGNLKHYLGKNLGDSDYVRHRDSEFNTQSGSRNDLVKEINETIEVVRTVLPNLSAEQINSIYPETVVGVELTTARFLIHLCVHSGFHLGQVGYLRRIITGNNQSVNPLSLEFIK